MIELANTQLDFVATTQLDRRLCKTFSDGAPDGLQTRPIRLAVLGSSTLEHLYSGIRVGGLRRSLWLDIFKSDYGQYVQDLRDPNSALRSWDPDTILLALDASHLLRGYKASDSAAEAEQRLDGITDGLVQLWRIARNELGCRVIQQTALPVFPALFGSNEHRLAGSPAALVEQINQRLRNLADLEGVDLLAVDRWAAADGLSAWYDPMLWHRAKQEVHPAAGPMYGDLVARILAAHQGKSSKCLVLDLDNTLWGGVIGDDGLDGIVLGQGSALGEAFVAFQCYARDLSQRGIILAVCSKNDEANALEPFEKHDEMLLRRSDIACFMAGWQDKASAIRQIAKQLNIGIDSLVFADDNPAERAIVRRELPMVAVPELPADPGLYATMIARAGYFEAVQHTAEDMVRTEQYQANLKRESIKDNATDMQGYLQSLGMEMRWSPFRAIDQKRIVQLINKTNQFNLTTCRYSDEEVAAFIDCPDVLTLQMRLIDQFGDNGIVSLIIGRLIAGSSTLEIDTWLMSCRVLGRQAEHSALNLLVTEALRAGISNLVGRYRRTEKNGMVEEHYAKLGFLKSELQEGPDVLWEMDITAFVPHQTFINTVESIS